MILQAKIYQLENNKYSKQGDLCKEVYSFEGTSCPAKIDFDAVFKALRR